MKTGYGEVELLLSAFFGGLSALAGALCAAIFQGWL
jgi:hypothetical protein